MTSPPAQIAPPEQFANAKPFPHVIVDGMFPDELIDEAYAEFPDPDSPAWRTFTGERERGKQECQDPVWLGPSTRALLAGLTCDRFRDALVEMTGVEGLVPSLLGGGMHQSAPGARLGMHTDFNRHPETGMERVLNVLLYLNRGWRYQWGGNLLLGMPPAARKMVTPQANRLVIFRTSDTSWHGHPELVVAPHVRRSVAAYYYAPAGADAPPEHSTVWA